MRGGMLNCIPPFLFNQTALGYGYRAQMEKYLVGMHDTYMSGWGMAEGKKNYMVVICNTYEQAETIMRNAELRPEMVSIGIFNQEPPEKDDVLYSWYTYDELGHIWKK